MGSLQLKAIVHRFLLLFFSLFLLTIVFFLADAVIGPSRNDRQFAFGSPVPPLFLPTADGLLYTNPLFTDTGQAVKQVFSKKKTRTRIVCLGESSVTGWPDVAQGGFPGVLKKRFVEEKRPFEVINAGVGGYHSGQIRAIFNQTLQLEPDIVVFYMGHNEYGYYLWNKYLLLLPPSFMRFFSNMLFSNLVTWAASVSPHSTGGNVFSYAFHRHPFIPYGESWKRSFLLPKNPAFTEALKMFPVFPDLYWRRRVKNELFLSEAFFAKNLRAMIDECHRRRITPIVCTVASNLRDFPPVWSFHDKKMSLPEMNDFDEYERKGRDLLVANDSLGADAYFRRALEIDGSFAETHYLLAHALLRQKKIPEAREHFTAARDLSPMYCSLQRAPSSLNQRIRRIAMESRTELVDIEHLFFEQSDAPGLDLFVDNLHPNQRGAKVIADGVSTRIR